MRIKTENNARTSTEVRQILCRAEESACLDEIDSLYVSLGGAHVLVAAASMKHRHII